MGVHYFYTWITRRYPLIRKKYNGQVMPDIDNFYIDLNGVLYRCAKDEGAIFKDILKGKGFDEIFSAVVNYINFIVNHVKPNKRLFIAVDGVAPRAKMNNQRQRRYHSAKSNKDMNFFLKDTLKSTPGLISYKNNSISPGTEFMITLIRHLKFFIQRKIHEDHRWRKIQIILSGGDVPGEGEHKIMDWIRSWKQSDDFDINETHCVYGNDSDLVFLCLSLHLPNMVILREEQKWDRRKVNSAVKREFSSEAMELLFINLLREYFLLEYREFEGRFNKPFDIERIIDDFTMLSFFIGNDFLHKLYCMNTKKGNFDEIIARFKEVEASLDDYITYKGTVNWKRFLFVFEKIEYMENKMIHTTMTDMEYFLSDLENKSSFKFLILENQVGKEEFNKYKGGRGKGKRRGKKPGKGQGNQQGPTEIGTEGPIPVIKPVEEMQEGGETAQEDNQEATEGNPETTEQTEGAQEGQNNEDDNKADQEQKDQPEDEDFDPYEEDIQDIMERIAEEVGNHSKEDNEEKTSVYNKIHEKEFKVHYTKIKNEVQYIQKLINTLSDGDHKEIMECKADFYKKFFDMNDIRELQQVCIDYLKGVQFVMYYYFRGCPSWSWYYPYFMSPMLSDLIMVLKNVLVDQPDLEFTYQLDEPFKPFNQLMYILPKASIGLMPKPYGDFIFKEGSELVKFYPEEYSFAPFDSIKEYMWIAEIEVMNKDEIDEAMKEFDYDQLTDEENFRNRRGDDMRYSYDPEGEEIEVTSTLAGIPDFKEKIKIVPFDIRKQYTFNWEEISLSMEGLEPNGFPTLFLVEDVKVKVMKVSRRARYDRVVVLINSDPDLIQQKFYHPHSGVVFYDYPFRQEGNVNTILSKNKNSQVGKIPSKTIGEMIKQKRSRSSEGVYFNVFESMTHQYYHEKGIDLKIDDSGKEYLYEVERPISSWRTVDSPDGVNFNNIIHELTNVKEIHPHTLIFKKKNVRNMQNISKTEDEFLVPGTEASNLTSGDRVELVPAKKNQSSHIANLVIQEQNFIGVQAMFNPFTLMETDWNRVDGQFMKDIGLRNYDPIVIWLLIDSFVIQTDASQTSSIVLGELFDIGLRFMDCLSKYRTVFDMRVVTDFIRIVRINRTHFYALKLRKGNEMIPHDVFLSDVAKDLVKEYVNNFPEVVEYIQDNAKKYSDVSIIPRDHDVRKIFEASPDTQNFDPNILLFDIYSWIMQQRASGLKLNSALCLNASSKSIEKLVKEVNKRRKKFEGKQTRIGKTMTVDKNCLMYNNPSLMLIGTTFKSHPEYPNIGDRIVFTSNHHKHIRFGMTGTVVGTYKLKIEVLFDTEFIGGTNLYGRCPPFRGGIVDFFEIFDLTLWPRYVNRRKTLESGKNQRNIDEWNGRVDLMLLIHKMNDVKQRSDREHVKAKFYDQNKKGQGKGNNDGNGNNRKPRHQKNKLKKTSAAYGDQHKRKKNNNNNNRNKLKNTSQSWEDDNGFQSKNQNRDGNNRKQRGNGGGKRHPHDQMEDEEDYQQDFHLIGENQGNNNNNNNQNQGRGGGGKNKGRQKNQKRKGEHNSGKNKNNKKRQNRGGDKDDDNEYERKNRD